ncbi:hypothetical protein WNZ14_11085 [Hoeflea sp. AS60]|uniref:hypothetical protein n=1 Tax=Hoeflea sp. AS60 TaxID=3135780 RepID=UPI00317EDE7C
MSDELVAASTAVDPQAFAHIRVVIGVVTGLSVTRLLGGLSRFVQHPALNRIYPPHLAWVFFVLLSVIHFWWFEFGLFRVTQWGFGEYVFVLSYAALIFFISTLLFPDHMADYSGYENYFHSRQKWFYGLLATFFVVDMLDSALKGGQYFEALGSMYPVRQTLLSLLCIAAAFIKRRSYHLAFAIAAIVAEIWWIFSQFRFLE